MCGICGVVNLDGRPVTPEILQSMTASIAHRGPDAEGAFFDAGEGGSPAVGLGHRRLAIIDLSPSAAQPMTNSSRTLAIVFNGEIYNFKELRLKLEKDHGHMFRSSSDTEVVLRLYEELGERCVDQLDGMFAFAIWDQRRRHLFLARDRVGKKPLYYVKRGTTFAFASEVKALLCHPEVAPELSHEALPHYFLFGYPPAGRTFYQDILQLPPAHTMTLTAEGRPHIRRYWNLEFSRKAGAQPSLEEASSEIRRLLTEAVRKRLVADVPLGAFLSGGVDSSIIVGIMSRLMDKPVKTFSLGFTGDPEFDETPFARQVASHFRTDHTEFIVEPKAIDLVETIVRHYDGPFGDSSAIPTLIVSRLTRQHVTVALNGDGGDELFAGYLRFQACLAADHVPSSVSRIISLALNAFPDPKGYHHWLRRAQRFFAGAPSPFFERLQRWIAVFDDDLPQLLRPEVFKHIEVSEIGYPPEIIAQTASLSTLSKLLYVNFATYLPEDLLVKADRATMAYGLEGRSPFLDQRLMEYVAGLPDDFKLRWGTTKYILKKTFADLLPAEILHRSKRGFGVPLGVWFRGELREYVQDLLLVPTARSRDYLEPTYVATLVSEHLQGVRDHGSRLWALLAFEVWLQSARREVCP